MNRISAVSGLTSRWFLSATCLALVFCAVGSWLSPRSVEAAPAATDVMFVFDTTGSMDHAIEEAKTEAQEAMTDIRAQLPDVEFGLAEMKDYTEVTNGLFEYDEEDAGQGFQPWILESPIGSSEAAITTSLSGLTAVGGGDGPEAYGRALFETAINPGVGWRSGALGVIVLVADNVPHDNELNEGIVSPGISSPFDTGVDPGRDDEVGTSDDLDWQSMVLPTLVSLGRPLEFVDYHGEPEYFPYWQNWSARTGGGALEAGDGGLAPELTEAVVDGANAPLPPCQAGTARDGTDTCTAPAPAPSSGGTFIPPGGGGSPAHPIKNPCIQQWGSGKQKTIDGSTFYDRVQSRFLVCEGFGSSAKLKWTTGMSCAVASGMIGIKFHSAQTFIDGACSAPDLLAKPKNATVACGYLTDVLGALTGPVGKFVSSVLGGACATAPSFGAWWESKAEMHAAQGVVQSNQCLTYLRNRITHSVSWKAQDCGG